MKQGIDMTVNRLPARTWNWLKMNEARLKDISAEAGCPLEVSYIEEAKGLVFSASAAFAAEAKTNAGENADWSFATGMGEDMDRLMAAAEVSADHVLSEAGNQAGALRLAYTYPAKGNAARALQLTAEKNSVLTLAVMLRTDDAKTTARSGGVSDSDAAKGDTAKDGVSDAGLSALQIRIRAEEGAKVRLYLVQMLDRGQTSLCDIGGVCAEDASVELVKLELGAGTLYAGAEIDLAGKRSSFVSHIAYRARENDHLDMNYTARHRGKKTESLMNASGVMENGSFKLFRGTIDLQNGCAGAKGTESEEALLLGDNVINQTIPLILCGEEDVEGNHGASIGRLDERVLFYLCSRGLTKEAAEQLMARAKIDAVCEKIPLLPVREEVQRYLGGEEKDDEEL